MKKIRIIGFLLFLNGLSAQARSTAFSADSTVQVQLTTNGTVAFTGGNTAAGALKGLANKVQNQPDSLIKRVEESRSKETKIFTKKEDSGKSHGSTTIGVPKNFNLKFQTATGSVSLTDVEGNAKGKVGNGAISVLRGKGKLELNTDNGDVTVTDSEANGFVMTRRGNVTLQDVRGKMKGISQNGKVTVKTTAAFFANQKATRFQLNYDQADLDIAAAPEGGDFVVGKGDIISRGAQKNMTLKTDEGNLSVSPASMGVRASTRKGKVSVQVALNSTSLEPIIIEAQDGDAELLVPLNFAGSFMITLIQTKNLTGRNVVSSFLDLGTIKAEEQTDPKSKQVVGRITQISHVVRGGRRPVQIRVTNGNINIKRI